MNMLVELIAFNSLDFLLVTIDWIVEQWDRLGHSYRANRELGRVFKTEHLLQYMSDKALQQRTRKGLLKGEQIHA